MKATFKLWRSDPTTTGSGVSMRASTRSDDGLTVVVAPAVLF